jgi:hypothetical protein
MILLILVGLYAVVAKRVRVTHSFQLTGERARNFGATLIIAAIPATIVLNRVVRPFLPRAILSERLPLSVVNVVFLAVVLFGTAWYFRDPGAKPPAAEPGAEQSPAVEQPSGRPTSDCTRHEPLRAASGELQFSASRFVR